MTEYMRGDAQDVDVGVRGYASLNNSQTTQEIRPDFTLSPSRLDPERDVVIGPGSVAYNASKGGYDVSGEQVSFETARLVRYRPGGLSYAGTAVVIPSPPPAGRLDVGVGGVPFQEYQDTGNFTQSDGEILLRLRASGDYAFVIRRDNVETIIPRSQEATAWDGTPAEGRSWDPTKTSRSGELIDDQNGDVSGKYWGFDAVDGSGPDEDNTNRSGLDLDDYPLMIIPKLQGTWYGKGPYFLGFEVAGSGGFQRDYPAVSFEAATQSITTRASLPLIARYDDEGAGQSFDFSVYGRQGSGSGPIKDQPKTPFQFVQNQSIQTGSGPADAQLLMAFRRAPEDAVTPDVNYRGTVFGLLRLGLASPNRAVVFTGLDPDFGGQTPAWGPPTSVSDQVETSIQTATLDTGGGDLTADATTSTVQEATLVEGGGKDTAGRVDPVDQPTPRTKPLGIFAFATDNAVNNDVDLLATFQEEGA
jgi:hypothetical protein